MNNVVARFCPWFKFYFRLFLGITTYDNEFETKENASDSKLSQDKNDVEAMWSPVH